MPLRLVQAGRGETRDLVVLYYLTAELDARVRAAAPDAVILSDTRPQGRTAEYRGVGTGLVAPIVETLQRARELSGAAAIGRVIVVGFSAGCQAVRSLELHAGGLRADAVITIDGTHASTPPAGWQIDVWRRLAAEARDGRRVWIATHTAIRPPTFASTREVLELATGWRLDPPSQRFEGSLMVWSYPGTDARAHVEQARDVLPRALAAAIDELGRLARAPRSPQDAPSAPAAPSPSGSVGGQGRGPSPLGRAVLSTALEALTNQVREVPAGSNSGPVVDAWLRAVGASPPAAWCAAGVSAWLRGGAARAGVECPVAGSAGAQALGAQFRTAGRWVGGPRSTGLWSEPARLVPALHLLPGQVIVWRRGGPGDWRGHVGILELADGPELHTIEPNSGARGDRVARMVRRLDDPRLLGVGLVTTPEEARGAAPVPHQPTEHELAEAARLLALGAEVMRGEPCDPLAELADRLSS